jgi:hypothetical protein
VDASKALAQFAWAPGDTDVPGLYRAEFKVTFGDGKVEKFPNGDYLDLEILADLG